MSKIATRNTQCSRFAILFVLTFSLIQFSLQNCAFTVDTDGTPRISTAAEAAPSPHTYSQPFICEKQYPGDNCCNDYQNNQLASNFQQIDATFGSLGNGCDYCGSNLKRFWCIYTCAPNQSQFMTIGDKKIVVPNPLDEGATTLAVMDVSILIDSQTVCDIWNSCNLTPYANQVSAMKTPAGFLSFLGQNGVTQALQYISMSYTSEAVRNPITVEGVTMCNATQPEQNHDPLRTQPWYPDQYGFNISQACSCNNCASSCEAAVFTPISVMEGFNYLMVGISYGFIIVFTIVMWYYRKTKQQKKHSHSQIESNNDDSLQVRQ